MSGALGWLLLLPLSWCLLATAGATRASEYHLTQGQWAVAVFDRRKLLQVLPGPDRWQEKGNY
jgi:hypothetical protein